MSVPPGPVRYDEISDQGLVELLRQHDPDALEAIYRRYGARCYRLARRVTYDDPLAEDAVQDAFLGLWRNPSSFDAERGSLAAWLLGLTHHKAVDLIRQETARQRRQAASRTTDVLDPAADDPTSHAWASVRRDGVRAALAGLPDAQRQILGLAYFGGYSQSEIAGMTGVPLGTVKSRTTTAMRRLQRVLRSLAENQGEEP